MDAETLQQPIRALRLRTPICVAPTATVREVVTTLQESRGGCVLVTEGKKLLGIFTERDVLKKLAPKGADGADVPVSEMMTPNPVALHVEDTIVFALHQMHVGGYRHVPLVDSEREAIGIVSVRDIVDYLVEHFEDAVLGNGADVSRRSV